MSPAWQHCSFIKMQVLFSVGHAVFRWIHKSNFFICVISTLMKSVKLSVLRGAGWKLQHTHFRRQNYLNIFFALVLNALCTAFCGIFVLSVLTSSSFSGAECSHNTHSHLLSNLPLNRCPDLKWQRLTRALAKTSKQAVWAAGGKKRVIIFTKKNVLISDKHLPFFLLLRARLSTIW